MPSSFVAAAPGGHWAVVCETAAGPAATPRVRLTPHGEFDGDPLRHVFYLGTTKTPIDDFAGADPTGRYVAFVVAGELLLQDTSTAQVTALPGADVRATQASFQSLRSVTFSDDGRRVAYLRSNGASTLVVRDLARKSEQAFSVPGAAPYRIEFTPGGRYVEIQAPVRDTNKNGRLDWLTPVRKDPAPCPSPIPTYNVWQYPGDDPDSQLLDVETGKLSTPEGFVLAAGNVVVRRTEDQGLLAVQPGKPALTVSSKECLGRVLHVDSSGALLFGCSGAWGQRRQMFLRTADARVELGFDLAAYELDTLLPTREPVVALYPGNQTLLFNLRTRERWLLLDGTQVIAVSGTTALIERELQLSLIALNPDASTTPLTTPVTRAAFTGVLRQGTLVVVGQHLFDLNKRVYLGKFATDGTPLALSRTGEGLYPARSATPTELGTGPFTWQSAGGARPERPQAALGRRAARR